jgi:IclR family transcriptional regulator, KDG regulon repressor
MATVDRVAAVLFLFLTEPELGVREMGRRLDIDKSSAHRLASGLARANILMKDEESGRYRLGLRLIELGFMVQARNEVLDAAWPKMRALHRLSGESVHLGVLDGLETVMIGHFQGVNNQQEAKLPHRSPPHTTSLGKAILAYQDEATIDAVIAAGLKYFTRNTITESSVLLKELEQIRTQGYALSAGERAIQTFGVGAPIRNAEGRVFAAISVTGTTAEMAHSVSKSWIQPVKGAANDISGELGWEQSRSSVVWRRWSSSLLSG